MMPQDSYAQADAPDPVLEDAAVLTIARRHLASASAITAVDETGGEARAYVIDGTYIFKTQRPNRLRPRTSLEKAAFHQEVLAKEAPEINVPRVLGYGREGDIEYVLETRMLGAAVRDVVLDGAARRAVLVDLGRTLRRIHSLAVDRFDESGLFPGDENDSEVRGRILDGLKQVAEANVVRREGWPLDIEPEGLVERLLANAWQPDLAPLRPAREPGPGAHLRRSGEPAVSRHH